MHYPSQRDAVATAMQAKETAWLARLIYCGLALKLQQATPVAVRSQPFVTW